MPPARRSKSLSSAPRWSFYTASPPDYPRRFSLDVVGESFRKFALTLWNTYSFFVTYANIDGFDPRAPAPAVSQRAPLDRWILSELNNLVRQVDDDLAHYEMTRPARAIQAFVEDLSNWYVRRSRRRFWKSEADQDKAAAHRTLYECLVTLCKLFAPFQPFTAEELYQNLVRSWDTQAPESVHFCDYPQADATLIDDDLMASTRVAMRVVALGHAARNQAGIKVRQPLALAIAKLRSVDEEQGLWPLVEQMRDELNVRELVLTRDECDLVDYSVSPVPSQVGKKYKALFPAIKQALAQMSNFETLGMVAHLRAGQALQLTVQDQAVTLSPEDVQVQTKMREGFALAEEGGYMVVVSTEIREDLRQEGLAREIVRRIQTMRKDAGFRIEDTITTYYLCEDSLAPVFSEWGKYIRQETLSRQLLRREPPEDTFVQKHDLDGESVTLGVRRQGQGPA